MDGFVSLLCALSLSVWFVCVTEGRGAGAGVLRKREKRKFYWANVELGSFERGENGS